MSTRSAATALLLAISQPLSAQAAETVVINGVSKPAAGKLVAATAGDAACYLDFENAQGDRFSEMAEFSLCDQTELKGQWLRLDYTTGRVMADSCQGDPACKTSQEVVLIHALQPVGKPDAAPAEEDSTDTGAAENLADCKPDEFTVFHCSTGGGKHVSVCATSAGADNGIGSVSYRFGKFGSTAELELVKDPRIAKPEISGRSVMFAGGGGAWLRFARGNHSYVVHTAIGRWGPNGEPASKDGVVVERNGAAIARLSCIDAPSGELAQAFFDHLGVDPQPEDEFSFPD